MHVWRFNKIAPTGCNVETSHTDIKSGSGFSPPQGWMCCVAVARGMDPRKWPGAPTNKQRR